MFNFANSVTGKQKRQCDGNLLGGRGRGCIEEFNDIFPELKISYIFRRVDEKFGNKILRKVKTFHALWRNDIYIFGGGGLFPVDEPQYYYARYSKLKKVKKLKSRVIAIYGIDVCRIQDEESKKVWNDIAKITDYLNFRNNLSAQFVNDCLNIKKASAAPDISFSYTSEYEKNEQMLSDQLIRLNLKKRNYIMWALAMPWSDAELRQAAVNDRYNKLVGQLIRVCNRYGAYGYTNVFLPFYHISDCKLIEDVAGYLEGKHLILEERQIPLGLKRALFKEARASVSMRFHGIAFSLYHGTPVAAISYAPKSSQIMQENGLNDYYTEFGIRAQSCFFKEFDIDEDELIRICDKAILENDRDIFGSVSMKLRREASENEGELIRLIKESEDDI